ncbi:MAG: hypothetical protein ACUVV6_09200, partial [Thermoplasmatota archaeon]
MDRVQRERELMAGGEREGNRAGVIDIGVAIPWRRLSAGVIAEAWGAGGGRGERAVASHDEDAVTLAVQAALDCLGPRSAGDVGALYFASVSAPYLERSCGALVAAAADLGASVRTADFSGSTRAGADALCAAVDAVDAGRAASALVAAADCRLAAPGAPLE